MPKKPSTVFVMQNYQPLSSRRFYKLAVKAVSRLSKAGVRFELSALDDPQQAGRTIIHDVPAVLAPNSPLCEFLAAGFGLRLAEGQSLDLATVVGRVLQARFSKARGGNEQKIAAIRFSEEPDQNTGPTTRTFEEQERTRGLG